MKWHWETEIDRLRAELAEWKEQFRVLAILEQQKTAELTITKAQRDMALSTIDTWRKIIYALQAELTAKDARIAELETERAKLSSFHDMLTKLSHALARAEKAEAALAIVQSKGGLKEKVALLASENGCLRAELSQTKRDLKDWQDSSEAYRHDAEKAEAQLNQACGREHDAKERCAELEKQCAELSGELETVSIECAEARAALALSPAGEKT